MYLVGQGWNCRKSYSTTAKERDKDSETVAFIGISSGNHGEHEYQQLSMEDRLADKVRTPGGGMKLREEMVWKLMKIRLHLPAITSVIFF